MTEKTYPAPNNDRIGEISNLRCPVCGCRLLTSPSGGVWCSSLPGCRFLMDRWQIAFEKQAGREPPPAMIQDFETPRD